MSVIFRLKVAILLCIKLIVCGSVFSISIAFAQTDSNGNCPSGVDCIYEELKSAACVGANGFLGQINIASVINLSSDSLVIRVLYFDQAGTLSGEVGSTLGVGAKQDFILNDLGLEPDTIGTVCVSTETSELGAWGGGLTVYKPNTRDGDQAFGDSFDYALYHPFRNPLTGTFTAPVNTFHIGTNPLVPVANWLSLADAKIGDDKGVQGTLSYHDQNGAVVFTESLSLSDGERADFAAHDRLTDGQNIDKIGLVRFVPSTSDQEFSASLTRYFYDCESGVCEDMLTAFVLPHRPPTDVELSGGVSTEHGEISIVEVLNPNVEANSFSLEVRDVNGVGAGDISGFVNSLGTHHEIVNGNYVPDNSTASVRVQANPGSAVSASSIFYKLDADNILEYAYAAPLLSSVNSGQLSEFNSFISHSNILEAVNTSDSQVSAVVTTQSARQGAVPEAFPLTLAPRATMRILLDVPLNTYGTISIQNADNGFVFRNYMRREGQYSISFAALPVENNGFTAEPDLSEAYDYSGETLPIHFRATTPDGGDINETDNTPTENQITNAGATLGRVLFYDKRLSLSEEVSCASCHHQSNSFSDPRTLSVGFAGGFTVRHSMSLANARFYERGRFFWDERAGSLEEQVLQPIQDSVEMGMNLSTLLVKLRNTSFYPPLFQEAFGSSTININRVSRALAQFVRSLVSFSSKYDQAFDPVTGETDFPSVFNAQEMLGLSLFQGTGGAGRDLNCNACHTTGAQVSDDTHNIGLDAVTIDPGAGNARFKAPSLRNIALSAPYMHDGRFESLEQVVEFYNSGVQDHTNLSSRLRGPGGAPRRLNLSQVEKEALTAFLNTLTDTSFISDSKFSDPFN